MKQSDGKKPGDNKLSAIVFAALITIIPALFCSITKGGAVITFPGLLWLSFIAFVLIYPDN